MSDEHRLGPYQLLKRLGIGGMAETWLAVHQSMIGVRKFVALKCILPAYNDVTGYIRLFYHEAGIALRLQHPNLLSTWSCVPIDGRHVMTMEYLRGITLYELLNRMKKAGQVMRYDIAVWIAVQILSGLEYLHTLSEEDGTPLHIIHRDVTPENIFLCFDGQCKLFDFGIAQTQDEDNDIQKGMIVGKPAYMSPEQCQSAPLDGRSDDYSLAIILYEMTTGIQLFERESDILTINALMNAQIIPPSTQIRDFPSLLSRIIMHALEREPARRYESSEAFANDLRMYLNVNGKTNAQPLLHNLIEEFFSEEIKANNDYLSRKKRSLDETAPSIDSIIAESKPIRDIPSTVSECIAISKLEQLTVPKVQIISGTPCTTESEHNITQEQSEISEKNITSMPKNVTQRMKKWIFGSSQSNEHSNH